MFYITNEHPDAPGQWCLCEDGKILKKYGATARDRSLSASALMEADPGWGTLVAAGEEEGLATWEADPGIAFTGIATSDKRLLVKGQVGFRAFPMPWMLQTVTAWGHQGAVIAGRIDDAKEKSNGDVWAVGVFDSSVNGKEAERLAKNKMLRGVSVDIGAADIEFEITEVDEDGWPIDWLDNFFNIEIMGATQTPFPAFGAAAIKVTGDATGDSEKDGVAAAATPESSLAAAGVLTPPVSWFSDPQLKAPTPLTITDEGQIFGHIASWNSCHIGYSNSCVAPPKSLATYDYFATGAVKCDTGCDIRTGTLTIGTGHADIKSDARRAASHYDNTGSAFADVTIGEDEHGIWVAGGVRPGTTEETIYEARASSPSGDWRRLGGNLELVAVLMVNVPGFPVARTASGAQEVLLAAAAPRREEDLQHAPLGDAKIAARFKALEQRVTRHEKTLNAMAQEERQILYMQLHGETVEELRTRLTTNGAPTVLAE